MTADEVGGNPHGIHYLRAIVSFGLVAVHASAWLLFFGGHKIDLNAHLITLIGSVICVSGLAPMAAGAAQALYLKSSFRGSRLASFDLKKVILGGLFLVFIEDVKIAFFGGLGMFLSWNVTHLIGVSLILTLLLARFSIWLVAVSAVACIALTPFARAFMYERQIRTLEATARFDGTLWPTTIAVTALFLIASALIVLVVRNERIASIYKRRLAMIVLSLFAISVLLVGLIPPEVSLAVRVFNLPAGALTGDHLALHYWPLFPWYSIVAGGFVLFRLMMTSRWPRVFRFLGWSASICLLCVFYKFYLSEVSQEFDPSNIWSSRLFSGSLGVLFWSFGAFGILMLGSDAFANSRLGSAFAHRLPVANKCIFVYSRGIFWIYVTMNTLGIVIAWPFVRYLPLEMAFTLYLPLMFIICYAISVFVLDWFARRRFGVSVVKVDR